MAIMLLGLGLLFMTAGCQSEMEPAPVESVAESPEQMTKRFYSWYLDYARDPETGEVRNLLVNGAKRQSPYELRLRGLSLERLTCRHMLGATIWEMGGSYDWYIIQLIASKSILLVAVLLKNLTKNAV